MQESCQVLVDVRGDEGAYNDHLKAIAKIYLANYKVIHRRSTGYSLAVHKLFLGVYSYPQVMSYIRLENVDNYN